MSVTIKRTLIRPKGREEYESRTSASQLVTIATQEIVQTQEESTTPSTNRAPARETETALPYYAGENVVVVNRQISSPKSVQSNEIKKIVTLTQDDYDSLTAYTPGTLYFVYEPEFSALTASVKQNINIPASGLTLTSANLGDYFTCTATEVFNDGSTTDVTAEATFTMTAMTIGANSSGERSLDIPGGITAEWDGHSVNFAANVIQAGVQPTYNIIRYVSTNDSAVTPYRTGSTYYGAEIVSNTYYPVEGYGEIVFDGDVTKIGEYAFQNCTSLSSIIIPDNVTTIGERAFQYCSNLSSITIPDSVTSIEVGAFQYCSNLSSVTIPNSVTLIGQTTFYSCTSLSSVTIPSGVTSIGNGAFQNCTSLSSITIPSGVTSIGNWVFANCESLSSVTIPSGVTVIANGAFSRCTSLSNITYNGTKAQWASVLKGDAWHYNVPATVVHCTDGDVSI